MILHYYLNEKYVGPVDIETFFDFKQSKTLITCTDECELLLGSLELVYGKRIQRFNSEFAYSMGNKAMPKHIFLTRKSGKVLQWDDRNMGILCSR